jgi:hypothetical protein
VISEQRTSARKIVKVKAVVALEGQPPILARTMDVGANGVSLAVPGPLPAGQIAQVTFGVLVDGIATSINARSKVMYCILGNNEFKVGFQFLSLELATMTALARFLR